MCLVRLDLDNLPLFSKSTALLLSCISLLRAILYPCGSMKYLYHGVVYTNQRTRCGALSVFVLFYGKTGHHLPAQGYNGTCVSSSVLMHHV